MYRGLALVLIVAGCSSEGTPNDDATFDASTGETKADAGEDTTDSETDTSSTTDTATEGTATSATTDTDDGGTSIDAPDAPDADVELDSGLLQCEPFSAPLKKYSEAKQELAAAHSCSDSAQRAYAGESCGYLVLSYTYGAGDTVTTYYDLDSQELVGRRSVPDVEPGTCEGEVPTGCFSYGGHPGNDRERLCSDVDSGLLDASPDDTRDTMDGSDVPDSDADVSDASVPDASTVDGSVDASTAG